MRIEPIYNNIEEVDRYILAHPEGTLYHQSGWKKAIENTFHLKGRYIVASEGKTITGILPLFELRNLSLQKVLISVPFAVYGGILADSEVVEQELLAYAKAMARDRHCHYLELRNIKPGTSELERTNLYVTYRKKLKETEDQILMDIPQKSRASIRNGYKKFQLGTRIDTNIDILYHLYLLNKRRLGSPPYPKRFFLNLAESFGRNAGVMTTYFEDRPVCSVLFFIFRDTILPYFSGSDHKYFYTNANNLMYYELMKHARKIGLDNFDFGRSRMGTGPARFKEFMGYSAEPLHYSYYLNLTRSIPKINPSNSKFNLVSKIWSGVPLQLTALIGPRLIKYLP